MLHTNFMSMHWRIVSGSFLSIPCLGEHRSFHKAIAVLLQRGVFHRLVGAVLELVHEEVGHVHEDTEGVGEEDLENDRPWLCVVGLTRKH